TPKQKWMAIPLMYEDPFYDVNYVYGAIIALRMYAMYGKDPKAFAPRYAAMMKNGYTAPPAALLKRFFDIDLDDPLDDVVKLLDARVDELAQCGADFNPPRAGGLESAPHWTQRAPVPRSAPRPRRRRAC